MGRNSKYNSQKMTSSPVNNTWNIAVYIRLSREDQRDAGAIAANAADVLVSASIREQKKIIDEFLLDYFGEPHTVVDYYIDDGLSGTDDTRTNFMRMVQDIEQKRVNCVVCKTLSRAFRNYSDQGYYLEYYFPQKNVRFISTGDPNIDTHLNPEVITGLEVPITGLMNDRFAAKTSSDIRRTFNTKRRNGEFIGAFPPYGYLKSPKNKNKLILDEEIVPIKRDILGMIVRDGMSLNGVAKRLNELGIPNPTAYKRSKGWNYYNPRVQENDGLWTGSTVRRILLDKVNVGHMVQGKQRVVSYKVHDKISVPQEEWFIKENTHEPTFSQQEYDTLERLLTRDTKSPTGKGQLHLFSGFLRCKDCGKALHRKTAQQYVYYACRTYTEKSQTKCTKHSIRLDLLEEAVLATIQAQLALLDSLGEIVDEMNRMPAIHTQSERTEKMLGEKRQEAEKLRRLSDGLYLDWKTGHINQEDYRRMKTRFEQQIAGAEHAFMHLEKEKQRMAQEVNASNSLFAKILQDQNITQLDRSLLAALVDTIYVHEEKEITIVFRFQDELERILDFVDRNTNPQKAN